MTMTDKPNLQTLAAWETPDGQPRYAWVADRPRRTWSMLLVAVGLVLTGVLVLAHLPLVVALAPLVVSALAGAWLNVSGGSGYYEVAPGGALGAFHGRRPPEGIDTLHRVRV